VNKASRNISFLVFWYIHKQGYILLKQNFLLKLSNNLETWEFWCLTSISNPCIGFANFHYMSADTNVYLRPLFNSLLDSLLCSTQQKYVYKTWAEQGVKQGVEQWKLPCSCSTPCSANDEKLKVKIEKLELFFSCFGAIW
jgi:hypothetical protein